MEKLQPKLRFPNYINNYNNILFNEVVESYGYGPRFNANDYSEIGNVKTIRGTDISLDGEIKYIQVPTAILDVNTVNTHKLLDGDLVMITTADCGLTGVFRKQDIDFIPSAYAVRIRLNENANSFYFKYFFQTKLAKNQVNKFIRKATVANLPGSDILKFNINLPNFHEQTRIANFLSSVDEKINLLKEKKALLEEYKKGIMQKIFNQEIRFKDDNGNDFEDWEEKTFGEMSTIRRGASPRPITDPKWFDSNSEIGWVRISDVSKSNKYLSKTEQYLSDEGVNKSRLVKKGNLIMSICATIGKPIYTDFDVCIHDGFVVFENLKGYREYFYYYLQYIQKNWYNYGQPGTQINLNSDIVSSELLLFPSIEEQTKIANFLSAIDEKIELVSNQIIDTQEYKNGLLQQMFV